VCRQMPRFYHKSGRYHSPGTLRWPGGQRRAAQRERGTGAGMDGGVRSGLRRGRPRPLLRRALPGLLWLTWVCLPPEPMGVAGMRCRQAQRWWHRREYWCLRLVIVTGFETRAGCG